MANPMNNVTTANDYADAATISEVYNSQGGAFVIANAAVYYQVQYGALGQAFWTDELFSMPMIGQLEEGTLGIRFRSAVSAAPAQVSAIIAAGPQRKALLGAQFTGTI